VRLKLLVFFAAFLALAATGRAEVKVIGNPVVFNFEEGKSALPKSAVEIVKSDPNLRWMVDTVNADASLVIAIEAGSDGVLWIARSLHQALNAAINNGRKDGGRCIVETAGLNDPFHALELTRQHEQKGREFRYVKIYVRKSPWVSREEYELLLQREKRIDTIPSVETISKADTSKRGQPPCKNSCSPKAPLFGGVTIGISSAPQSNVVLCAGVRLNIRPRLVGDVKIGHSILTNDQHVNDGTTVEAYGMLYSASVMYVVAQWQDEKDTLKTNSRFGLVCGVTQVENDTKSTFDYLIKRRVAEAGLAFEYKSVGARGLIGYGWDEYYDRLDVDYKVTGRLELVVTL